MCDTMVATPEATADGVMLFAKNSDREPNEAQYLEQIPALKHAPGSMLKCTYIEIPQVPETYAVMLSKPFWIWGAEMGTNQFGLTIGNEAVFTKEGYAKEPSLIGMDLLRLALERARDPQEAIEIITGLLEIFGQGGNCGFHHKLNYHNSFIICDAHEAWVLETAGKFWAAKQIRGVYAISNGLTLTDDWDMAHPQLAENARQRGWCKDGFSFSGCYSDTIYTKFSDCRRRRSRAMQLLQAEKITPQRMMQILRDHADHPIHKGLTGACLCNHAGFGPVRGAQTTGSLVSYLRPDLPTHFATGSAAPCTGIFKPVWQDCALPEMGQPGGEADRSLFWQHERLHRAVLMHGNSYAKERDALERELIEQALGLKDQAARQHFCTDSFSKAAAAEEQWISQTLKQPRQKVGYLYRKAWNQFNRQSNFEENL